MPRTTPSYRPLRRRGRKFLALQDVLRGVRWAPPTGAPDDGDAAVRFVEETDIPTAGAVAALAAAAGQRSGVSWRELQPLLVAYSGLRWGGMAVLTADGCSTMRVTQELYISADGDLFDRFYRATE